MIPASMWRPHPSGAFDDHAPPVTQKSPLFLFCTIIMLVRSRLHMPQKHVGREEKWVPTETIDLCVVAGGKGGGEGPQERIPTYL